MARKMLLTGGLVLVCVSFNSRAFSNTFLSTQKSCSGTGSAISFFLLKACPVTRTLLPGAGRQRGAGPDRRVRLLRLPHALRQHEPVPDEGGGQARAGLCVAAAGDDDLLFVNVFCFFICLFC